MARRRMVEDTLDQSSDEEKADYGVIKEKIRVRPEAVHLQAEPKAPADHASNTRNLINSVQDNRSTSRRGRTVESVLEATSGVRPRRESPLLRAIQPRLCIRTIVHYFLLPPAFFLRPVCDPLSWTLGSSCSERAFVSYALLLSVVLRSAPGHFARAPVRSRSRPHPCSCRYRRQLPCGPLHFQGQSSPERRFVPSAYVGSSALPCENSPSRLGTPSDAAKFRSALPPQSERNRNKG